MNRHTHCPCHRHVHMWASLAGWGPRTPCAWDCRHLLVCRASVGSALEGHLAGSLPEAPLLWARGGQLLPAPRRPGPQGHTQRGCGS